MSWRIVGMGLVTALAAFIRFYGLGRHSLWYDEFCAWHTFESGNVCEALRRVQDLHSPGFALLLTAAKNVFALDGDFAVRVVPALLGKLTVPLLVWIGARLFNWRAGLLAGLFLAVCPIHFDLSRQVVCYALAILMVIAAVYAIYNAFATDRARWWLAAWALSVAALYSHPFMAFALATVTAGLALEAAFTPGRRRLLLCAALMWVCVMAAYVPWVAYGMALGRYSSAPYSTNGLHIEPLGFYDRARVVCSSLWQGDTWSGTLTLPVFVIVVALLLSTLGLWKTNRHAMVLVLSWACAPACVFALCLFQGTAPHARYLGCGVGAVALLLGLGATSLFNRAGALARFPRTARAGVGLALATFLLWNVTVLGCKYLGPPIQDYRGLGRLIERVGNEDHVIVTAIPWYFEYTTHDFVKRYAPAFRDRIYVEDLAAPYARTQQLLEQGKVVWYVVSAEIPQATKDWLKATPSVAAYEVGADTPFAAVLIPESASTPGQSPIELITQIERHAQEAFDPFPVRALSRMADNASSPDAAADYCRAALERLEPLRRVAVYSERVHFWAGELLERCGHRDEAAREYAKAARLSFGQKKAFFLKRAAHTNP